MLIRIIRIAVACLAALTVPVAAASQQDGPVGTIIVAHGGGPDWDAQVHRIAELTSTGGPVEVSFLMGTGAPQHRFQDAAERLEEAGVSRIVVVPMLMSSHSSHYRQIGYLAGHSDDLSESMRHHLEMAGITRADVDVPLVLTRAVDDSPAVADVLSARAVDLASDPTRQALFLIGHGPNSAEAHAEWMRNLRAIAQRVRERTGFRHVMVGLVRDDAPAPVRAEAVAGIRESIELQHLATGRDVVVVPVLISTGSMSRQKIPADLQGLPVVYSGEALLPHPGLARWVEERVNEGVRTPREEAPTPLPAAAPSHHQH